jgi:hypothetical protein
MSDPTIRYVRESSRDIAAVDWLVLTIVNAPYRRDIAAAVLGDCLAQAAPDAWPAHVAAFFTDVPTDLIFAFAARHKVAAGSLIAAYRAMTAATGERNPDLEAAFVALASSAR